VRGKTPRFVGFLDPGGDPIALGPPQHGDFNGDCVDGLDLALLANLGARSCTGAAIPCN